MIRAICLNPVIDRSYRIEAFSAGKKYFSLEPQISVGGKGTNVAKVCRDCGEEAVLYCFIAGHSGALVRSRLDAGGIKAVYFEIEGNTRETINILDGSFGTETELLERGPEVSREKLKALMERLEKDLRPGDIAVCSGITLPGTPAGFYGEISRLCRARGASCYLDANSVSAAELREGRYELYKPNREELSAVLGRDTGETCGEIAENARGLLGETDGRILVSLGAGGGILVTRDYYLTAAVPQIGVRSTIGSGDSVVAGFAVGKQRGWSDREAFRFAMACGTVNAMYTQVGHVDPERVKETEQKIRIEMCRWPRKAVCGRIAAGGEK